MKISIGRILAIGIPLGILCAFVKNYFQIPDGTFGKYYTIFGIAAIVLAVWINGMYQFRFAKKLNALTRILTEEKDVDRFINENEKLLHQTKGKYHKALIHINLCAGYSDKDDFETAKEELMKVTEKDFRGINQLVYFISLAYIDFRADEIQEALAIMKRFDKEFTKLESHNRLGGHIAILRVFEYIYTEQLAAAQSLLNSSTEKWTDHRLAKAWEFLQALITKKENQME